MELKIAIIGAGISGLAAGYQLRKAGIPALILEKESCAGGRIGSENFGDFVIDRGAYTLPESHKTTLKIIRELGLEKELREVSAISSTFHKGKAFSVQIGSPKDFLKYKLLSLKNKKDLIQIFLYAVSLGKALNLEDPSSKTFELEREAASEYLLREYDRPLLETIAYPIFCERFLGTPENNSKAAFLSTIKILTKSKIFSLNQGMGSLAHHLMKLLNIRFHSAVLKVRSLGGGRGPYQVDINGPDPKSLVFDRVIFALPMPLVLPIFEEFPDHLRRVLSEVQYAPSLVCVMGLERSHPRAAFINSTLRDEFRTIGTVVFDDRKNSNRTPEGKSLITVIVGEKASRALLNAPEDSITFEIKRELKALFPGLDREIVFSKLFRWEYAAVQLQPGALARQSQTREVLKQAYPNLYFIGDGLYNSSIEVQMKIGINAAEEIIVAQGS